jgi:four helix bundle protein
MKKVQQFEDFEVWKKASSIATTILDLTNQPPLKNDFSTKDQIRRSAFSISSNIAEGFEYDNNRDFIRFLRYAKGSAGELRSQLYILYSVEMINDQQYQEIKEELLVLSRQLSSLINYLKKHT